MKTPVIVTLITATIVAVGGFTAYYKMHDGYTQPSKTHTKQERYAAMQDGTWAWLYGRMGTLTKHGQIVTKEDGTQVHIMGDMKLAKGQEVRGYFQPAPHYEYVSSNGTKERLQNFTQLAGTDKEFCREMQEYYDLLLGTRGDGYDTPENRKKLTSMHEKLKSEGLPLRDLNFRDARE